MTMDEFDELEYRLAEAKRQLELEAFDGALLLLIQLAKRAADPAVDAALAQQICEQFANLDTKYIIDSVQGPFRGR